MGPREKIIKFAENTEEYFKFLQDIKMQIAKKYNVLENYIYYFGNNLKKEIPLNRCNNIIDQKYKYYDAIKHLNLSNYYFISSDNEKNH